MKKMMLTLSALFISASICTASAAACGENAAAVTDDCGNVTVEQCRLNQRPTKTKRHPADRDPRKDTKPQRPTRTPRSQAL